MVMNTYRVESIPNTADPVRCKAALSETAATPAHKTATKYWNGLTASPSLARWAGHRGVPSTAVKCHLLCARPHSAFCHESLLAPALGTAECALESAARFSCYSSLRSPVLTCCLGSIPSSVLLRQYPVPPSNADLSIPFCAIHFILAGYLSLSKMRQL